MTLEDGLYTIRYLAKGEAPEAVGGMYAPSKDEKDKPVTAEPLGPESKIRVWWVTSDPDKDAIYTITELRDDKSIPGQWARKPNEPESSVELVDRIRGEEYRYTFEWGMQEDEGPNVYNIRGDSRIGSTDRADLRFPIGESGPEVFMHPVVPGMYIPRWVFTRE
ncbi:macrocypin 5a [Macrolepiota fuliginosa MF-IS2]|uniref:Macrocypin 5a n=1 Tax=Macrolepiota fuliginosa MF-IS2 TaxID=1400762 RepID=A0A9P6BYB4_9AGAR|nr:macrocypin 5a [Macrolepiota fuliginosa MF-IS2]